MRISFLLPCYVWAPAGGPRVVYEYANRLVSRGHQVSVVHPLHLRYASPERLDLRAKLRHIVYSLYGWASKPTVDWQPIDKRVELLFVPSSDAAYIPDADVIFATSWPTVRSVLECPPARGEKCYFIQGYETWQGPKALVDATWQAPLHKVIIAKWLMEKGEELGCQDMTYIPNAMNHEVYKLRRPIEGRRRQVAMAFSTMQVKGSADGIKALEIAKKRFSDLKVVFFSTSRRQRWVPEWVEYYRNPAQEFIVNEIFSRSSIFLSPSLSEGWPLPPAEAAACGCAIVSTSNGGVREYIEHGVTGLLSPLGDPQSLAQNLCLLLENENLRVRLAQAGNSFVSRLNWENSVDLLEDFIEGVAIASMNIQKNIESTPLDLHRATAGSMNGPVDILLQQQGSAGPFVRWHLRRKFHVMEELFRRYLEPGAKLADIACGTGDALVLASLCVADCEGWGLDMDDASLRQARQRIPAATLHHGDMHDPKELPKEYFDVVHEFGASCVARGWNVLARAYLSLLKDGGILLWELPQRWSLAHISYLLTPALKRTADETKLTRIFRSILPSKYRFESDASVLSALQMAGCDYEILERVSIGNFYFPKKLQWILDWAWRYFGDGMFDMLDKITRAVWRRDAGYYLVIRKRTRVAPAPSML
jgi:glycosyltransferase involved in cell wall biosynthesis/ubiquinone/menaquinone biosynthesis C-methylase UbiE